MVKKDYCYLAIEGLFLIFHYHQQKEILKPSLILIVLLTIYHLAYSNQIEFPEENGNVI